jgi:hypothetical protein
VVVKLRNVDLRRRRDHRGAKPGKDKPRYGKQWLHISNGKFPHSLLHDGLLCAYALVGKPLLLEACYRCRDVFCNVVGFVKSWEIIADNLSKAGWSLGCVSAVDSEGRTIWIVDAHRDDGRRFIVHSDEKLTAFLELESATRACGEFEKSNRH